MKKFVFRLDIHDDKDKRKAMKLVSTRAGVDAIAIDMKSKQLTVIGTVDPVSVVIKLRKSWHTEIVLVGPAKEPEKKEEGKKEEVKKDDEPKKEEDEPKEEEAEQEGEAKKEEPKKEGEKKKEPEPMIGFLPYQPYYRPVSTYYYYAHQSTEEKIHYTSSIKLEPYHIFNGTKENKKHMPTVNLLLHSSKRGGESKFVRCLLIS